MTVIGACCLFGICLFVWVGGLLVWCVFDLLLCGVVACGVLLFAGGFVGGRLFLWLILVWAVWFVIFA